MYVCRVRGSLTGIITAQDVKHSTSRKPNRYDDTKEMDCMLGEHVTRRYREAHIVFYVVRKCKGNKKHGAKEVRPNVNGLVVPRENGAQGVP